MTRALAFSFPPQVNEHAARLVATVVTTTLWLSLLSGHFWPVPLLAAGFLLRVGWGPRFSPLARLAMSAAPRLWSPKPVTGAPKRFAQGIGAVCTVGATLVFFLGLTTAAWSLVALVAVFAFLEAALGFCMGCWLYGRLQEAGVFPNDVCVDCGPAGPRT